MSIDVFIRNDELVLSTALRCIESTENFMNFAESLHKADAAGLILAFENQDDRVPNPVLTYTAEVGLPIFQIPWKYRFSEVLSKVLEQISASNRRFILNCRISVQSLF